MARKGDAAGGGTEIRPGDMNENRAAAPRYARPHIVVDFDNEIIKAVAAAEPVAWSIGRAPKRSIVAPVGGVLAPRIVDADGLDGKQAARPWQAIGPPPDPNGVKAAGWGAAIAFPLVDFDPAPPQRDPQWPAGSGDQPTLRAPAGPPTQRNGLHRILPHPDPCFPTRAGSCIVNTLSPRFWRAAKRQRAGY